MTPVTPSRASATDDRENVAAVATVPKDEENDDETL